MRPRHQLGPKSVAVVLGTRPEIIKLAEIIRLLGPAALVVHTGQHYDQNLAGSFFHELGLPAPDVSLALGGTPRGQQLGTVVAALDEFLARRPVAAMLVQGDTNATLAGALAANARDIPIVHVEAGLRSFDRAMPEEHNRVLTDHLADLCCATTEVGRANLAAEGIGGDRVEVTGNTVVEALTALLPGAAQRAALLRRVGVARGDYVLATFHRPENVDDAGTLARILGELQAVPFPVVLPLHPRTRSHIAGFGLTHLLDGLRVIDPTPYGDFLGLAASSAFLISDSGGVQEEVSVLKRPLIVVRQSTERPEVLGTFAELVSPGDDLRRIAQTWARELGPLHDRLGRLPSPYGDGSASRRCVAALQRMLLRSALPEAA